MANLAKFLAYGILAFFLLNIRLAFSAADDDFKKAFTYDAKELLAWRAPAEMYRNLRYYQSGVDSKGRPVIFMEVGKWDKTRYMAKGGESAKNLTKYLEQSFMRLSKESDVFDTRNGFVAVFDAAGYSLRQLVTPGVMSLYIRETEMIISVFDRQKSNLILANMAPGAVAVWNIMRWMYGTRVAGIEVYGVDQTVERLLQDISKDQLPTKYGGDEGFKPVKSFDTETDDSVPEEPATQEPPISEKEAQSLLSSLVPAVNNTSPK